MAGLWSLLEAVGQGPYLRLFQLLEAVRLSIFEAGNSQSRPSDTDSFCLRLPHLRSLVIILCPPHNLG